MTGAPTLGDVLAAVITTQIAALGDLDQRVRADEPDAVHQYRVTLRRLRSVLAAFSAELDPVATAAGLDLPVVTVRLRDAARAFGLARDAEVNGDLATERIDADAVPAGDDTDEVRRVLAEASAAAYQQHRLAAIALLDGFGPETLSAVLTALATVVGPGLTGDAGEALARTIDDQAARVLRSARKAKRADPAEAATALHEVRKKAKRLRYTIEDLAAQDVAVPPGRQDVVDAAHRIQKHLGTHHDSVGLTTFIRAVVAARPATGPRALRTAVAFTAGELAGAEHAVQQRAMTTYRKARRALRDALA